VRTAVASLSLDEQSSNNNLHFTLFVQATLFHSTRTSRSFKTNHTTAKMRTTCFIKLVGIAVCLFALASEAGPVRSSSLTRILQATFH
jgi:hypothetical protein